MPELPEVETIKQQLEKEILGKKIIKVEILADKILRTPKNIFLKNIQGSKVIKVERKAKLLFWHLSNNYTLLTHLKMTGQYIFNGEKHKHTRAIFYFSTKEKIIFNDLRLFAFLQLIKTNELPEFLKGKFGPEPIEKEFTLKKFKDILKLHPKMKIKQLLLEQKLIAGIGNIYVQEACFMANILPTRLAESLTSEEIKKLKSSIIKIIKQAIIDGGTSTDDYLNFYGQKGDYVKRLKVYSRKNKPCYKCKTLLSFIKIGGRGTVYCSVCQK